MTTSYSDTRTLALRIQMRESVGDASPFARHVRVRAQALAELASDLPRVCEANREAQRQELRTMVARETRREKRDVARLLAVAEEALS